MIRHLSRYACVLSCAALAAGTSVETTPRRQPAAQPQGDTAATRATARASRVGRLTRLPLSFERNEGQTDPSVKFLSHGHGYTLFLSEEDATLALRPAGSVDHPADAEAATVTMRLNGGAAHPRVQAEQELPGLVNYLIGNDPAKWRRGIRTYGQVRYENVYPGVDVVYHGDQHGLEFDFILAPGVDPRVIALDVQGAKARIDDEGGIVLNTVAGDVVLRKPVIYQQEKGIRREIAGGYVVDDGHVRFSVSNYDQTQPLIIDPYVTYLGGTGMDNARGIAIDNLGDAYVTGWTNSPSFPPFAPTKKLGPLGGGIDIFVAKLDSAGYPMWLTYVGGSAASGFERGNAIAVDAAYRVYVTGDTGSFSDFPVTNNAFQQTGSGPHGFMFRLDSFGATLDYSTYIGGDTEGWGIAVDAASNAYVSGRSSSAGCLPAYSSTCFPVTMGAFQIMNHKLFDAFVMKIDPAKSGDASLVYSTLVGGTGLESADSIAIDSLGQAYVTGDTYSKDDPGTADDEGFPVLNAFQPTLAGGRDAFVTVVNKDGNGLVYSTYLGGILDENYQVQDSGIAVDADGNAYVTATTRSGDLKTSIGFQVPLGGAQDAFVAKFDPAGGNVWLRYLGGSSNDSGTAIAVDPNDQNAYVTGSTESVDFPTASTPACPVPPTAKSGVRDAFVTRLDADGAVLVSRFLGGSGLDEGYGIAIDGAGNVFVTGDTDSINFPTTVGAFQGTGFNAPGSPDDGFVAMLATGGCATDLFLRKSADHNPVLLGDTLTYEVTVSNKGTMPATEVKVVDTLQAPPKVPSVTFMSATTTKPGATCAEDANFTGVVVCDLGTLNPGDKVLITIVVKVNDQLMTSNTLVNTASVSSKEKEAKPDDNHATITNQVYASLSDLEVSKSAPAEVYAGEKLTYTITVTNHGPSPATGWKVIDPLPAGTTFDSSPDCSLNGALVECQFNGTLAKGDSKPLTFTVTVDDVASVTNEAIVQPGNEPDLDPTNNKSKVTTIVKPAADLAITKVGPAGPVDAGTSIHYTITVTNNGPSTATNVTINDPVPLNTQYVGYSSASFTCSPGPLNPPDVITCSLNAPLAKGDPPQTVTIALVAGDTLSVSNKAAVTALEHDPNSGNNTSEAITPITPVADLSIEKKGPTGPVSVYVKQQVPYAITVKNNGPSTVSSFTITDMAWWNVDLVQNPACTWPPQGNPGFITCDFGPLAPGNSSAPLTIFVTPRVEAADTTFTNRATVAAPPGMDKNPGNGMADVITTVKPAADVALKVVWPSSVLLGNTVTYTITVQNLGPSAATGIVLEDKLPANVTFQSSSCGQPDAQNIVTCIIEDLAAGATSAPRTITVKPTATGTITNTAGLGLTEFDPDMSNNISSQDTTVSFYGLAAISIDKLKFVIDNQSIDSSIASPVTLPASLVAEATSAVGTVVNFDASASDGSAASCAPASGSTFPLGTTTVSCSATDPTGTVTSSSFTMAVVDTRPPALALPGAPPPSHNWLLEIPQSTPPGTVDVTASAAWDSGFSSMPVTGVLHAGVARSTRAVCSAGYPVGGRAGVVVFDGTSESHIDFGDGAGQYRTDDFAVSLWVSTLSTRDRMVLLSNRSSTTNNFFELSLLNSGSVVFELNDGSANDVRLDAGNVPHDGSWHFIVVRRVGATSSLFVDGVLVGSANGISPVNITNGNRLLFGAGLDVPASSFFEGSADPVEYGLIAALIAVEITAAVTPLDDDIQNMFSVGGGDGTCGVTDGLIEVVATGPDGASVVFGPDPTPLGPDPTPIRPPFAFDVSDPSPVVECKVGGIVARSGDVFPIGETVVTCTATDATGNSTRNSFTVVVANTAPTVLAGANQIAGEGVLVSLAPATFTDANTADIHTAVIEWGDGTSVEAGVIIEADGRGTVAGSHVYADNGIYTVTVTVTDGNGDSGLGTLTVTVNNAAPTVVAGADQTVGEGTTVSLSPATFSDKGTADTHTATIDWGDGSAIDAGVVAETPFGPPGSVAGMDGLVAGSHVYVHSGNYIVTVKVVDDDGASTSDSLSVTVLDTTPPIITGTPSHLSAEATSPTGAVVTYTAPTAVDATGRLLPVSCSPASGSTFPLGTTSVVCTATDSFGNTASASFNVTVVDTTPPVVTVPANMTADATSLTGAVVTFTTSAFDIVDSATAVSCMPGSSSTFSVGTTTVYCLSIDSHDNLGRASFTVTVLSPQQITADLIADVVASGFQQANNLLQNALKSLSSNNLGAACNQLDAFINQVKAQSGRALTAAEAAALIQSANDAKGAIGCKPTVRVPQDAPTIQAAIDMVPDGGIVRIAAGTYQESVDIAGKRVDLVGVDRDTTIIRLRAPAYDVATQRLVDPTFPLQLLVTRGVINYGRSGGGSLENLTVQGGDIGVAGEFGGTGLPSAVALQNVLMGGSGVGMAGKFSNLTLTNTSILNSVVYGVDICSAVIHGAGIVVSGSGSVGVVVYSCYPPGVASASLVNANISNNPGGGALFNGNMGLSITNSVFDHNGTFGILLANVSLALILNTSANNTSPGKFHLWNKAQGIVETFDGIADGLIAAFGTKALITSSQFIDNQRAGIVFDSAGSLITGTTATGGRFGLVAQETPKPNFSDPANSFSGTEQAILADGDLPVPKAPPIPVQ